MDVRGNKSDTDSPCIGICSTTVGGHACRGCKRTRKEIDHWGEFSDDTKREINEDLKLRKLNDPYTIHGGYADA